MKKLMFFMLSMVLVLSTVTVPLEAQAATLSSKAGAVTVSSGSVNVRRSASTASAVLTTIPKGSYLTLLFQSGEWWKVEYGDGLYGYCHADYVTVVAGTAATVQTRSGGLNVRSGPGTGYGKLAKLTRGEAVIVLSTSGGWSRILYHGTKTGYVSAGYLSTADYPAVSLSVPSYKQTDHRWAYVTLGSSGKTMAKIGCATTAVAMVESYRSGSTITPAAMAERLRYTSSGSLYWPDDYTAVTSSSSYLSGIYGQLRQGRAVLLGCQNAAGGQHWVVVTGYTGGSSLSAAQFTVNDPGSSSRTTLQQFLNAYPYFYKYFTY